MDWWQEIVWRQWQISDTGKLSQLDTYTAHSMISISHTMYRRPRVPR